MEHTRKVFGIRVCLKSLYLFSFRQCSIASRKLCNQAMATVISVARPLNPNPRCILHRARTSRIGRHNHHRLHREHRRHRPVRPRLRRDHPESKIGAAPNMVVFHHFLLNTGSGPGWFLLLLHIHGKIGRASCRERV